MNYVEQLTSIIKAAAWSQEQLAHELGVSFATLNAWLNERAQPRKKAKERINDLYISIIGFEKVDELELRSGKEIAQNLKLKSADLVASRANVDKLTLYLTYHTNTIEGSTMTLNDVEEVIFKHKVLSNRTAIEQTEARNHQAALHWLLDELARSGKGFTINEGLILGLHLRLMNGIMSDAGQYRNHSVRIMGAHVPLANWQKIPSLMSQYIDEVQHPSKDIVADLAKTHATFEQIHPFGDGNGRTGRLLLIAQALYFGIVPPLVVKERKQAYYKYLEAAQVKSEFRPLELFIAQAIQLCRSLLEEY